MSTSNGNTSNPSLDAGRPETSGEGQSASDSAEFELLLGDLVCALSVAYAAVRYCPRDHLIHGAADGYLEAAYSPTGRRRVDRLDWTDVEQVVLTASERLRGAVEESFADDVEDIGRDFQDALFDLTGALRFLVAFLEVDDVHIDAKMHNGLENTLGMHYQAAISLQKLYEEYGRARLARRGSVN